MRINRFLYILATIIIGILFLLQFNWDGISIPECFLLGGELALINAMGYLEHKIWGSRK